MVTNFAFPELIEYFEQISAIPRASYHEEKIADYLCEFAKKRGLECYRDSTNNVLIDLPATAGRENTPALLLQGHTDMICEKNEDVEHDFSTDGLKLYEENGWLRARGTTLGADNGVAVAIMLYILDGAIGSHGPIQCLFTSAEEVGMDGAFAFDYKRIYARKMINMDGCDESQILAGCSGGQRSSITFDGKSEIIDCEYVASLKLKGLAGGHSGEDIHKGRASANKLMARAVWSLIIDSELDLRLCSFIGGNKDNAIARECEAVVAVKDAKRLKDTVAELNKKLSDGLSAEDADFSLTVEIKAEKAQCAVIDRETAQKMVFLMNTVATGVLEMDNNIAGLVEWSRNLGIVKCLPEGSEIHFSTRSSFGSRIDASAVELDSYAKLLGAKSSHFNRYPGWSYAESSAVRDAYLSAYEQLFGEKASVTTIHAGLECGVISKALEGIDIISCGPIVLDLHSPDEALNIASFERFFKVIKKIIEEMK